MKAKLLIVYAILLLCLALPLSAEGVFALTLNNGSVIIPIEAANITGSLYASADYAFYLGDFILQPAVDAGACEGGLIVDAGLGVGYRFMNAERIALEAVATPYLGECGYLSAEFVFGARAMLRGRFRLIGRLGLLAQVGAEWRSVAGILDLPVLGVGLTL